MLNFINDGLDLVTERQSALSVFDSRIRLVEALVIPFLVSLVLLKAWAHGGILVAEWLALKSYTDR